MPNRTKTGVPDHPSRPGQARFSATPLTDFVPGQRYLGQFPGFLYDESNDPPVGHAAAGRAAGSQVRPLDVEGCVHPEDKIVFLCVGFSNASLKWSGTRNGSREGSSAESLTAQAFALESVNRRSLVMLNGGMDGQPTGTWTDPHAASFTRVRDEVLTPAGASEKQVQAIWMEIVNREPTVSLPASDADAYDLVHRTGQVCRALKARYPELRQIFLSPRSYGGYARSPLSPEPYAYETGFAVKWLVWAQIQQMMSGKVDPLAGDLDCVKGTAPWIDWGPYFWADGNTPRHDGLSYQERDFSDGLHPSQSGIKKIAGFMLNWFLNSAATPWFRTKS